MLAYQVQHQLNLMEGYTVFDWIEAELGSGGRIVLRGQVTEPQTKAEAEEQLEEVEGLTEIRNEIEVLPLSPADDSIRIALYRTIFNYNGPLFRYSLRSTPPIHIIVKNGRATLKGVVLNQMDKQLAYTAARNVPGVLEVTNALKVASDA
jgi:osmotically-inducible protein OsmY